MPHLPQRRTAEKMFQALIIAQEHCAWAAEEGQSPRDVIRSVGERWLGKEPNWFDAIAVIAAKWEELHDQIQQPPLCHSDTVVRLASVRSR